PVVGVAGIDQQYRQARILANPLALGPMRRGVHQDLVPLIVEPHRRETDPAIGANQTQSHGDRLVEQPLVRLNEVTQAQRFLALADCELALLEAVSDTTKIGYREAFRHCFLRRPTLVPRAINMEDQNSSQNNTQ